MRAPHVVRDRLLCLHTVISMEMKSRVSIVIIVLTRVTTVTTSPRAPVSTRVSKIKLNGPMLGIKLAFAWENYAGWSIQIVIHRVIIIIIHPRRRQNDIKVNNISGCGRPGRPEHGRVVLKRDGFLLSDDDTGRGHLTGDELVYSCEAGRTLLGNSQRRCRSDGAWSPSLPSCGKR